MKIAEIRKHLDLALKVHGQSISAHIANVVERNRTTGIENAFASALHSQFECAGIQFKTELSTDAVGVKQRYQGRIGGRVDCFVPEGATAFEYKAARLPRSKSSPKFDLGQIVADCMRLRSGNRLREAYIVVFLYGPLISASSSSGSLYRRFHNQMFIDQDLAKQADLLTPAESKTVANLSWNRAWGGAQPPEFATAVRHGDIGAVCVSVLDQQ
ncbi:hypothetical protein GOB57_31625 [Sinorhizobium meliloti]|nr:hypothetical protein [Sinorhizobium meliloti]